MSESPFIIVNPMAANKRVGREWPQYAAMLRRELGDFEFKFTERSGHASELARQALNEGYRNLASLGGDGTHGTVVNGFFDPDTLEPLAPDATLSILPVGTGGDFRRSLAVAGKDLRTWARVLSSGDAREVDTGHISYIDHEGRKKGRFFLKIASFGINGLVDQYVNRTTKRLGGKASFMIGTAKALFAYRPGTVTVTVDGAEVCSQKVLSVSVANGQYFGGGMWVAPEADLQDGLLDVIVSPWSGKRDVLMNGTKVYKGDHMALPSTRFVRGKTIRAEADFECLIDVDGEDPGRLPVEIVVKAASLRLKGLS